MIKIKNQHPLLAITLLILTTTGCDNEHNDPGLQLVSGAIIDAEVGGAEQPNQVFIDFSTKTQNPVNRGSWDLAFYNGPEFRVKLNTSVGMLAQAANTNNILDLVEEDTVGLGSQLDLDAIFGALMGPPPAWLSEAADWLDDPSGDLAGTVVAAISATADNNFVYVLNRGKNPDETPRGWQKIRILRNGDGYTLQYAEIGDTEFNTIDIVKNADLNFTYVSFEEGIVEVEPKKNEWDIAFTTFTNTIPISASTFIPYFYKDYVILNRDNVLVAEVGIEESVSYEDFTAADIEEQQFNSDINAIGSSWRTVAQPGSGQETDVNKDRFYVISDTDNNHYKFRFTRLIHPQTGERGFPQIEYELLSNK